ncbi:MAG: hypothetical protein E7616_00800 [Ruminococcaceae bacterium]|nr:hypothetical protein [Oscillospiraceae bacterium]
MNQKNPVLQESLRVAVFTFVMLCIMYGIFALSGYFSVKVLYSGFTGWFLNVANFFFMCVAIVNHTDETENSPQSAAAKIRGSYMIRSLVLLVLLFFLLKSGHFQPIATLVPLLFIRPAVMLDNFFSKTGKSK